MFLQLTSVFCESTDASSTSTPLGITALVLLLIDVVFLFYMLFTQNEEVQKRSTYIFLANGTFFSLVYYNNTENWFLYDIAFFLIILVSYYFLCSIPLATTIITVLNISVLFPIMNNVFLGPVLGKMPGITVGAIMGVAIAIVFAVFFPDFLMKVHHLFVVYVYTAKLVTYSGVIDLMNLGEDPKGSPVNMITAVILLGLIGVLIFMK